MVFLHHFAPLFTTLPQLYIIYTHSSRGSFKHSHIVYNLECIFFNVFPSTTAPQPLQNTSIFGFCSPPPKNVPLFCAEKRKPFCSALRTPQKQAKTGNFQGKISRKSSLTPPKKMKKMRSPTPPHPTVRGKKKRQKSALYFRNVYLFGHGKREISRLCRQKEPGDRGSVASPSP